MASKEALVSQREVDPVLRPDDVLLCASGVDASEAGPFTVGGANATTVTLGRTGQTVNVAGNLTVTGSQTSSTVVNMADRVIRLGATTGNAAVPSLPIGIAADRGASAGVKRDMSALVWDEANSTWKFVLNTQGDDVTLGAYQSVQAGAFYAPTLGRVDAGVLALGGAATSIVPSAPITFATGQLGTVQFRTLPFTHADLTAVATSQALDIGAILPANAKILGKPSLALVTPFTDGAGATVSLDIGTAGDPDALIDGADLDAAAVDGQVSSAPEGIAAGRLYTIATQLLATVTADVNVDTLNAGDATITVAFTVTA